MGHDWIDAQRVRAMLSGAVQIAEKPMMGSLVFMVNGHMCCGLGKAGLMIRVGPDAREQVLELPHARPMRIGTKSPGAFVRIDASGYREDADLLAWLRRGLAYVATLPSKPARAAATRR